MFDDEDSRKQSASGFQPLALYGKSIEELEDYIGELEEEIARIRQDIDGKRKARDGADSVFKKR